MAAKTDRQMEAAELAEALGVNVWTVRKWISEGCPCDKPGGNKPNRFNETEVAAWMRRAGKTGEVGRPRKPGTDDRNAAELRKLNAMADHWELKNAQVRGQLYEAQEVDREWGNVGQVIRNGFQSLAAGVAASLVGLTAQEIEQRLEERVNDILRHLARDAGEPADAGALEVL